MKKGYIAGCLSLKSVICEIPNVIEGDFFNMNPIGVTILYVPNTSLYSYETTVPWKFFGAILPILSDEIDNCTADPSADIDAIYNLEGKRINGTNRGLNIIRMTDGTIRKVKIM